MSLAFVRMYVDIPADTKEKLVLLASERGLSQKGLVAQLIEEACEQKPTRRKAKKKAKKRSKKRN